MEIQKIKMYDISEKEYNKYYNDKNKLSRESRYTEKIIEITDYNIKYKKDNKDILIEKNKVYILNI